MDLKKIIFKQLKICVARSTRSEARLQCTKHAVYLSRQRYRLGTILRIIHCLNHRTVDAFQIKLNTDLELKFDEIIYFRFSKGSA